MRTIINDVFDYSSTLAFHYKYKPPATGTDHPLCKKQVVSPLCFHPRPLQCGCSPAGWKSSLLSIISLSAHLRRGAVSPADGAFHAIIIKTKYFLNPIQ